MSRQIKFLGVDGFNLIRRIYEARQVATEADMASVIEATVASLRRALKRHNPTHAAVVLEHHDRTWRHLLYPEYKANRSETPPMLLDAIPGFEEAFREQGIACFAVDNYEADDVLATLADVIESRGGEVIILSTDKTYLQLLSSRVSVIDHFQDITMDRDYVRARYHINPEQYLDYLSLVGDSSNNIKGVVGIGPKSAVKLLEEHGGLDGILHAPDSDKLSSKVKAAVADAERARQLVTLKRDVDLGLNLKSFRLQQ